jgi:rhodanese-related sulfurtransferase
LAKGQYAAIIGRKFLIIMKRLLLFFLIIFLGWDALWALMGVTPLFPWQLQEKMKQHPPDLALLDVRTSWEFHWFHLPGARHLPFERGLPNDLRIPKTSPVVIICLTGHRSPVVAYRLQQADFTEVYSLTWGMAGWKVWQWIAVKLSGEGPVPAKHQPKASSSQQRETKTGAGGETRTRTGARPGGF